MTFVSLLLRSWMLQITQFHAMARTLADEIMIIARGSRALHIIQAAFEATMEHIADIGGRLAPSKSCLFATTTAHRTWLAAYVWTPIQQQIKVVHNLSDLGSALNSSVAPTTALSAARLEQAISAVVRIDRLPLSREDKGHFALNCTHSKGLYSCEASQIDEHALRKYTSVLLKVVGADNQMHARSLTFGFSGLRYSIDSFIAIFQRRVAMLRRFLAKNRAKGVMIEQIYDKDWFIQLID